MCLVLSYLRLHTLSPTSEPSFCLYLPLSVQSTPNHTCIQHPNVGVSHLLQPQHKALIIILNNKEFKMDFWYTTTIYGKKILHCQRKLSGIDSLPQTQARRHHITTTNTGPNYNTTLDKHVHKHIHYNNTQGALLTCSLRVSSFFRISDSRLLEATTSFTWILSSSCLMASSCPRRTFWA